MNISDKPDGSINNIPDEELPNQDEDSSMYEKNSGADAEDINIIDEASEPSYTLDVERDRLPVKEQQETEEGEQETAD